MLVRLPCLPLRFISSAFYVIITAAGPNPNRIPRRIQCPANENENVRLHKFSLRKKGRKLSSEQKNEMTNEVCRLMAAEMRDGNGSESEGRNGGKRARSFEVCAI